MAASKRPVKDQRLFLVRDVNIKFDENAVMLHNGHRKIGYVTAKDAPKIRKIIDNLTEMMGQDQVIVVKHTSKIISDSFNWSSSIVVKGVGHVYERYARKVAQKEGE